MLKLANYFKYKHVDVKFDEVEIDKLMKEPFLDYEIVEDIGRNILSIIFRIIIVIGCVLFMIMIWILLYLYCLYVLQ